MAGGIGNSYKMTEKYTREKYTDYIRERVCEIPG
jgi:hypothetical protein